MTKNNKRIGMIAALVVAASVNAMAQGNNWCMPSVPSWDSSEA